MDSQGKVILAAVLLLSVYTMTPIAGATEYAEYHGRLVPLPEVVIPNESIGYDPHNHDFFYVQNVTVWLTTWNNKMGWGFSDKEIEKYSDQLERVLSYDPNSHLYKINNESEFIHTTFPNDLGLSDEQRSEFIAEWEKLDTLPYVHNDVVGLSTSTAPITEHESLSAGLPSNRTEGGESPPNSGIPQLIARIEAFFKLFI